MFFRRNWIAMTVVILSLVMFIPVAQAQRQDFECRQCSVTTYNVVHRSPEITIASGDQKSIIQSTHESKLFDNFPFGKPPALPGDSKSLTFPGFDIL